VKLLANPLPGLNLSSLPVNSTLHGRSIFRHRDVPGHNVDLGYSHPGTGDAVDVFCKAGQEVVAPFAGKVTRVADAHGRFGCVELEGAHDGEHCRAALCHLHVHDSIKVGVTVKPGQRLGWIGRILDHPHLHFELWIDGAPISDPKPRDMRNKIATLCAAT
jgi:murein DD-endopeptidase MepM/ murein hydrolase activator NlpD